MPDHLTLTEETPDRKRPLHLLIVPVLILIALAVALRTLGGSGTTLDRLRAASPGLLATALFSLLAYWLLTASSWRSVVTLSTNTIIPFGDAMAQIVTVNLGKYVPGKVWGQVARGSLMTRFGISAPGVVRASVLEQFYLLFTSACVAGLCWGLSISGWRRMALLAASVVLLSGGAVAPRLFLSLWNRLGLRLRPDSFSVLEPLGRKAGMTLIARYSAIWILLGASFAALAFGLTELPVNLSNAGLLVFANTVAYVAGFVALFAPGGLGVRESIGAALLAGSLGLTEGAFVFVAFRIVILASEVAASIVSLPRLMGALRV